MSRKGNLRRKLMAKKIIWKREDDALTKMQKRHGIRDIELCGINPYCINVMVPLDYGDEKVKAFANDLFHELGLIDDEYDMDFSGCTSLCDLVKDEDKECYCVIFNHHDVVGSEPGDDLYQYTIEAICKASDDEDGDDDEARMRELADGIKSGAIRSKSGEGFFVLKSEFFKAIKAGTKTTEYRDITPRNLSMSIGIKTVKLQSGYGHPGQPPEQMRFEVASVGFLDADDNECDPYNIPDGFVATTIAIHLGKRIG